MTTIAELSHDVPWDYQDDEVGLSFAYFWTPVVDTVPAWWSTARDEWLQVFWKKNDPTKIAVETFTNKVLSIPIHIRSHNTLIDEHVKQAEYFENVLINQSGIARGFDVELEKFTQDYLTTDNGGFMLVMGPGPANGPIVGQPSGLLHLDSLRCQRTGNAEFPVIYNHTDGVRYKLHHTRIIYLSNLPSARADMYGVGVCAVSCEIDAARELRDIVVYAQEKMGTRPNRDILYAETGTTISEMQQAIQFARQKMDGEGLEAFSKTLLLAPKSASGTLKLGKIELSSTPDGFNRQEITLINMALVASAFGMDLRDLSMNLVSSQTRADAEVADRKGRGKGVGTLLDKLEKQLNQKFLPSHLYAVFDNQDDDQDQQQANIQNVRSQSRERDLTAGALTPRVARQRMLRQQEITSEEFEHMELMDGRLPDGLDVYSLFFSKDPLISQMLDVGIQNPFIDRPSLPVLRERIGLIYQVINSVTAKSLNSVARQALSALTKLEAQEVSRQEEEKAELEREKLQQQMGQQEETEEEPQEEETTEPETESEKEP